MFHLSLETIEDGFEVETLFDLTFVPGREALSSYRLRDGVDRIAELCLVARDDYGTLAGAVRFWPVEIGTKGDAALLLGPIAVHPTHQGEGLGGLLMAESLHKARKSGWRRVVLVGDAPYYARFGFYRNDAIQFPPPTNPARLLAHALSVDGLLGVSGLVRQAQIADSQGK